jgi:hypothetical protein
MGIRKVRAARVMTHTNVLLPSLFPPHHRTSRVLPNNTPKHISMLIPMLALIKGGKNSPN